MAKKLLFILAALASAVVALGAKPVAPANDTTCVGTLPAGTYDNVVVPNGASCSLDDSHIVTGNIKVFGGLQLRGTDVRGNVEGDEADWFGMTDTSGTGAGTPTRVGGNVSMKKTVGNPPFRAANFVCDNTKIVGNLQIEESPAAADWGIGVDPYLPFCFAGAHIGGNYQASKNAGDLFHRQNVIAEDFQLFDNVGGVKDLFFNTIGENLQCDKNTPPPVGSGNTARQKEGQCAAL
jgi:hypothetical protein